MKKVIIDYHDECVCNGNMVCVLNPDKEVIFVNNQFIYLEYFGCIKSFRATNEFITELLENSTQAKCNEFYKVERSKNLDVHLRDLRIRGIQLKKYNTEINFIYCSNNGKTYAITSTTPFLDPLIYRDSIKTSYKKMYDFLLERQEFNLIDKIENLLYENSIYCSDKEVVKSIDYLVKSLSKNRNYETSK